MWASLNRAETVLVFTPILADISHLSNEVYLSSVIMQIRKISQTLLVRKINKIKTFLQLKYNALKRYDLPKRAVLIYFILFR